MRQQIDIQRDLDGRTRNPEGDCEETEAKKIKLPSKTEAGTEVKRRVVEQPENMQLRLGAIERTVGWMPRHERNTMQFSLVVPPSVTCRNLLVRVSSSGKRVCNMKQQVDSQVDQVMATEVFRGVSFGRCVGRRRYRRAATPSWRDSDVDSCFLWKWP